MGDLLEPGGRTPAGLMRIKRTERLAKSKVRSECRALASWRLLPAEPAQTRQLSELDPVLLWRDTVLAITDDLIGIAASDSHLSIIWSHESARHGACVLRAWVDIDSGATKIAEEATAAQQDAGALAWVRSALSAGPLLDCLRRRFRLDKHLAVEPPRAGLRGRAMPLRGLANSATD